MAAKIIIFEDNDHLRESLIALFRGLENFSVTGDYNNCLDAANIARVYQPDVVLMDIDMPGQSGIEGVRLIKENHPQAAIIMYTVFEDDERLFKCLCAGANGYLLKKTHPSRLIDAMEEVLAGGSPMSPSIARRVLDSFQKNKTNRYELTPREIDVLLLLTRGYSTKMIAAELQIAFDTTRFHLKNIYQKLHVNCGKEAVAKALLEHIV